MDFQIQLQLQFLFKGTFSFKYPKPKFILYRIHEIFVPKTHVSFCSSGKRSVWSITREQINYYTTQFFCLQSDPHGVIPGAEAKEFFERSKLPITDLRKIWQLSDVSQVRYTVLIRMVAQ